MEQDLILQKQAIAAEHSAPNNDLVKILNRVTAKAINSREEFLTFAGKAESQSLFKLCMDMKDRREVFASDLQHQVSGMGGEPVTDENFAGWIHHVWLRTRLAVESDSDYVIVSEAIREEESMRLALEDSMNEVNLPADIRAHFNQEKEYSESLRETMAQLKATLKPDDYVEVKKS
jgi:uncharacterized protein (TIGR02284 family)